MPRRAGVRDPAGKAHFHVLLEPTRTVPEEISAIQWVAALSADDSSPAISRLVQQVSAADPEWVRMHSELAARADRWEGADRRKGFLLRGDELKRAEAWLASEDREREPASTPLQRAYVSEGVRARTHGLRRLVAITAGVAVAVLGLGIVAIFLWRTSVEREHIAQSRALAAESSLELTAGSPQALPLAFAAAESHRTVEAERALRAALVAPVRGGRGQQRAVNSVAFSPRGDRLATGDGVGRLRLWDPTGRPLGEPIQTGQGGVYSVAFSPRGDRLATGGDGTLRLWDPSGPEPRPLGEPIPTFGSVYSVAFSPRGDRLATGSTDGTLRLWDPSGPEPRPLGEPIQAPGSVNSVAFSPRGDRLATGDGVGQAAPVGPHRPAARGADTNRPSGARQDGGVQPARRSPRHRQQGWQAAPVGPERTAARGADTDRPGGRLLGGLQPAR